jgi:hypothetical protein
MHSISASRVRIWIQSPTEKTDVLMLSSIQQCEEWRCFQGHRHVQHTREFSSERTCDSVIPSRWRHITYWTNEYGEVARSFSASSNITAAKITWFLSPTIFCGVIWRVAYSRRAPPLWLNSRPISNKRYVTCYNAWWMISLSASRVHHCERGASTALVFNKWTLCVSDFIYSISVR